ncbi:hypothetical protein DVH05_016321 [Phytophthora capsici]|nr:hypothetical protein DVH05_016321 [Phytophthora capsici]
MFEKTMKGLGTDEDALSATLVRYHGVLNDIRPVYKKKYGKELRDRPVYKKKYGKELRDRIHGETSGKLLLAVFDEPHY